MKFNRILFRILCLALAVALTCGIAAKLHVDGAEYKVEFDANGGTGVESQYVGQKELATAPADPTREGYVFVGWFYNENEWSFETPINGNIVLVAHWEKIPAECPHVDKNDDAKCDKCGADFQDGNDQPAPSIYSIVYMDGANKLNLTPSSYTASGANLTLPTPAAKAHLEFVGWYLDAEFTTLATEINANANSNLVFYAKYVPVTYTIEYELDGGVNAEANVSTYDVNSLPFNFAAPTKDGYEFKGWYTDANCTESITGVNADNAGNLTVFAKWEKIMIPYTVTYLDQNWEVIGQDIFYESTEDQPLRPGYELDGYEFKGWVHPRLTWNVFTCIPAGTAEDITVMAFMEKVVITHTITYFVNNEEYHVSTFDAENGVESLLFVTKPGYKFDGWYNGEGDVVTSVPAGATDDVVLYGTLNLVTYSIKYFEGETELFFDLSSYTISDTEIALPTAEKTGYRFMGWYTADDQKVTGIAANTVGDLVLYAHFSNVEYTISYVLNDGSNDDRNVTSYTYGNIPTLYAPLSRDGYIFAGWYESANFEGAPVDSIEEIAYRDSVTLFAKWIQIEDGTGTTTPEVPF